MGFLSGYCFSEGGGCSPLTESVGLCDNILIHGACLGNLGKRGRRKEGIRHREMVRVPSHSLPRHGSSVEADKVDEKGQAYNNPF